MTTKEGPSANEADTVSIKTDTKDLRYERWSHAVHGYVSVDLFRYVQFINRVKEVMFRSDIQRVVCKACCIPGNNQLVFWNNVESEKVQEVMKRKR
jgi:hypothetical protein